MPQTISMDPQRLQSLLIKYQNGTATENERAQVEAWYEKLDGEDELALSAEDKQAFVEQHWQQLALRIASAPKVRWMPAVVYRVAAAAVVLLTVGASWYFLRHQSTGTVADLIAAHARKSELIDKANETDKPLRVALSDGSRVTLQPGSHVYYPVAFAPDRREVQLVGEAFFDITKNPKRPFLVYANGLVTKVLGTSFTIVAQPNGPTAEVVVRTGRVAVYRQTDSPVSLSDLVLKPNEKATFFQADRRIVKALADHPVVLRPDAIKTQFIFDDTPVAKVFRELGDVYGVSIIFDEQALEHCTLTANLANQPLLTQLAMICLSIGATYQTNGTHIQINGRGCP